MRRLLILLALLLPPSANAASTAFSVTHTGASLTWQDQRWAYGSLDLGLGIDDGSLSGGLYWRATRSANLLGTLVWELRSGHDRHGTRFAAGLRGALGPVALRAQLAWGNRAAASPWPLVAPAGPPLPRPHQPLPWGIDGELHATWRIDRQWSLLVSPQFDHRAASWSGALAASLRRSGWFPDVDVSLHTVWQRPSDAPRALVGVTLHHVPRRAPNSEAGIWLAEGAWGAHGRLTRRDAGWLWHLQGAIGLAPAGNPSDFLSAAVERSAFGGTVVMGGGWGRSGGMAHLSWRVPLNPEDGR